MGLGTTEVDRSPLRDRQGRSISTLRLSLTSRCNFRCSYCSRGGEVSAGQLRREEIRRAVWALAALGVRRVRLTGGEPTLRRDLLAIVEDVRSVPGIEAVALTTNGQLLDVLAGRLHAAGVGRVNVSVDALQEDRLHRLSGRSAALWRVLRGFEAAAAAGFESVKMNSVVVQGLNEDEMGSLVRYAWRHGAVPRFIELMPFARGAPVTVERMKQLLGEQGILLASDPTRGWGPAYHMAGVSAADPTECGLVGFIGAMSEKFCAACNRIRLGPDGALRGCLGGREEVPLRDLLQGDPVDVEAVGARVAQALAGRTAAHDMLGASRTGALAAMASIGG